MLIEWVGVSKPSSYYIQIHVLGHLWHIQIKENQFPRSLQLFASGCSIFCRVWSTYSPGEAHLEDYHTWLAPSNDIGRQYKAEAWAQDLELGSAKLKSFHWLAAWLQSSQSLIFLIYKIISQISILQRLNLTVLCKWILLNILNRNGVNVSS